MAAASCAWPEVIRRIGVANIAHRGASAHAPENTIVAFERAFEMAADAIELDVRLTRDDVPIVLHDAELSRTTDGSGGSTPGRSRRSETWTRARGSPRSSPVHVFRRWRKRSRRYLTKAS